MRRKSLDEIFRLAEEEAFRRLPLEEQLAALDRRERVALNVLGGWTVDPRALDRILRLEIVAEL